MLVLLFRKLVWNLELFKFVDLTIFPAEFLGPKKKTSVGLLIFNLLCFLLSYSQHELQLIDGLQEHGVLIHDGEVYQDVIIAQEEGEGSTNTQDILIF